MKVYYNSLTDQFELCDELDYLIDTLDEILFIANSREEMEDYIEDNYPNENIQWVTPNYIAEELELSETD